MDNIEKLKEQADGYIQTARGLLVKDKVYFPVLYAVSEDSTLPVGLHNNNKEDEKEISEIMSLMKGTCHAMILIIDMHILEFDKAPKEKPTQVKEDPRSQRALICFIHTKEKSLMRQIRYDVKDDDFTFFTFEWEKMDEMTGQYQNPFIKD